MQEEFLTVVAEHRDRGATVFLSSHDLAEVERICDRVGIIRAGRLAAVESVSEMREHAYRDVVVRFAEPVSPADFEALPEIEQIVVSDETLSFRSLGGLDAAIKAIASHSVIDIEIKRPTLEELFLTYYDGSEDRS